MARRIFGVFLILLGVSGILLAVMGGNAAKQAVINLGKGMESSIDMVIDSLDTVQDSLLLTQAALVDVQAALARAGGTAVNVATTLEGTTPILDEMLVITTQDLPSSLETIEQAIPNAVEAADAIDATLRTLNKFKIDTQIGPIPIKYDLGINYDPAVPFSASVQEIGVSLEGLPERLRSLDESFADTQANLAVISQDMNNLSGDLTAINEQIAGFTPLVEDFLRVVTEGADNLRLVKGQIEGQVTMVNSIITLGMVWLVLSQAVPLYLGYELVVGRLSPGDEPVLTVANMAAKEKASVDDESV